MKLDARHLIAAWAVVSAATVVAAQAPSARTPTPSTSPSSRQGSPSAPAPRAPVAPTSAAEAWRAARWGMSLQEILKAFPGTAFAVQPELKLADGNTVSAGVDGVLDEGLRFNVRFVLSDGRLALVSLRTPPDSYADTAAYERFRAALVARWGDPLQTTFDAEFVDLRQTRWDLGPRRADLKYIPGVVALVFYPSPAAR